MPSFARPLVLSALVMALLVAGCARHAQSNGASAMDDTAVAPSSASSGRGASLYVKNCQSCHGTRSSPGPVGPSLRGIHARKSLDAIEAIVKRPDPPMPKLFPGTLSAQDVADIAAYVDSL